MTKEDLIKYWWKFKKEHKAKSVNLAGGEIWYSKPTFDEFIEWLDTSTSI